MYDSIRIAINHVTSRNKERDKTAAATTGMQSFVSISVSLFSLVVVELDALKIPFSIMIASKTLYGMTKKKN